MFPASNLYSACSAGVLLYSLLSHAIRRLLACHLGIFSLGEKSLVIMEQSHDLIIACKGCRHEPQGATLAPGGERETLWVQDRIGQASPDLPLSQPCDASCHACLLECHMHQL